jgi:hypothetical protein
MAQPGGDDALQPPVAWDINIDTMLAEWCDSAKCFEWMHSETHSIYESRSKAFMIATNCLTAVAGLSNVISGGTRIDGFELSWLFGGISIFVSTMNILQEKLGYSQMSIVHKKLASDWAVIKTKIEEVLALPYSGRRDCKTFLKYIKADINQANLEGDSIIPKHIKAACYSRFKSIEGFNIPDICGDMEHTKIYVQGGQPLLAS